MKITPENTVFVNYYEKDNVPKLGINDLFKTINKLFQKTESYIHRNDHDPKKKGEVLKIAAKKELNANLTGGAALGVIPFFGGIAQEVFIKPGAIEKASKIFGLDYNDIVKEEKNSIEKHGKSTVVGIGEVVGGTLMKNGFQTVSQYIPAVTEIVDKTYFFGIIKWGTKVVETVPANIQHVTNNIVTGVTGIGTLGISLIVGASLGYYFTSKEIDSIVNKLYEYYIKITPSIGSSYEKAVNYLNNMQNKYSEQTQTSI